VNIPLIFKASYEKDNRGSEKSYIGPGLKEGMRWLSGVKETLGLPVLSDIHRREDVDASQTGAGCPSGPGLSLPADEPPPEGGVRRKGGQYQEGQFVSPESMAGAVKKIHSTGNRQVLLTERGTSFGYNKLISDFLLHSDHAGNRCAGDL